VKDATTEAPRESGLSNCEGKKNEQRRGGWTRHPIVLAGLLLLLSLAAYLPALRCGFIWDDDIYVTQNAMLTDANGLREIWFSAHGQSQYFPLVYTTLRVERELWGLNPFGYHLVNILLHGLNAALVWVVLRRLQIPGAWLAAAIFALHPVQVETVAWVAELKNIESLFFYLLALLAWMKFAELEGRTQWRYYGFALVAYLLALFAKTTACTLPAAMVLVLWLRGQKINWLRMTQLLPFLVIGLGMGLVTVWWEKHLGDYQENFGLAFTFMQRVLIASRALWFYVDKLIWPVNLTISYPRWAINTADPVQYLPVAGCIAVAIALWVWRKQIGRGVIAGIIFFVAALSPLLGFIIEGSFHYSYVADHYQYNACIGLIAIFAALAVRSLAQFRIGVAGQAVLLLLLGALTWRQCAPYHDLETLWRDTLVKNPNSWMAYHNLGIVLFERGRLDDALEQYRAAVTLYPNGDREQSDLGTALLEKGTYPEAIQHLETAVTLNPKLFQAQNSLGLAYSKTGDYDRAIAHFQVAAQLDTNAPGTLINLGSALKQEGKLDEAIATYRDAAKQFPAETEPLYRLAVALSEKQDYTEVINACGQGLQLAPNDADFWLLSGNACLAQNNYEEAVNNYQKALLVNPSNAGIHYNLGITLGLLGKRDAEQKELIESLRLDPNFSPAQQELQSLKVHK
jgi:tetratricopeptide (TPR) repeat protein